MSLVGDALRKARQEAAERDNERKGVLFSARIAEAPNRSNLGLGIALGAAIAIVATVAGGLAVWWVLGGTAHDTPPAIPAVVTDSKTGIGADGSGTLTNLPADAESRPATDTATATVTDAARDTDSEAAADTATDTGTATVTASVTATDRATDAVPAPATEPASAAAAETDTGFLGEDDGARIYLMEADLGSVTLSLDYIIFRATDPYAAINGEEIHVGGTVDAFRLKAVESDRVVLSDGERTVVLRTP